MLLMRSAQREEKLAGMVQAVIDERFFRPVVTGKPEQQRLTSEETIGSMSDVTVFGEEEDAAIIAEQEKALADLYQEQFGEKPPHERHQEELQSA